MVKKEGSLKKKKRKKKRGKNADSWFYVPGIMRTFACLTALASSASWRFPSIDKCFVSCRRVQLAFVKQPRWYKNGLALNRKHFRFFFFFFVVVVVCVCFFFLFFEFSIQRSILFKKKSHF